MEFAIRSQGLGRQFGKRVVVDGLNLQVPIGRITAFLGPNGAGKTTTIRLLLGLLKPSGGSCEVLGYPPGHTQALAQLGAMVESPSLYDHLTATENLKITRIMRGLPPSEEDRVLSLVGLQGDAKRPVREYSLGMKQRLGIALALLGEPKLLILDEPTNGLDPEGIREMREMIRRLPQEMGATVFISSHILAEMEQLASDVVVIHRGRLKYQGDMKAMGRKTDSFLSIRVDKPTEAGVVLENLGFQHQHLGHRLRVAASIEKAPLVAARLVQEGLQLFELSPCQRPLEERFLALLEEP